MTIYLNFMRIQSYAAKSIPRASIDHHHHHGPISINTIFTSRDLSSALHELAHQVSQYYIILDGRLSRDTTFRIRGGRSLVYRGTLFLERKGAVVTTTGGRS